MPNWVENKLTVCGVAERVNEFVGRLKGTNELGEELLLNENALIPYPTEFVELDKIAYEWNAKWEEVCKSLHSRGHDNAVRPERIRAREKFVEENGERPSTGYNQGGHEWCAEHWGTKWGLCHVKLITAPWEWRFGSVCNKDKITLEYSFDTVWSPPVPLIKKMGEMFPELKFDLRYFGDGINGYFAMENGEETAKE